MEDALLLHALREEMIFLRVLLAEQYANAIKAGAATRDEMTSHIAHCAGIAEQLSDHRTTAIAATAEVMISALPQGYTGIAHPDG